MFITVRDIPPITEKEISINFFGEHCLELATEIQKGTRDDFVKSIEKALEDKATGLPEFRAYQHFLLAFIGDWLYSSPSSIEKMLHEVHEDKIYAASAIAYYKNYEQIITETAFMMVLAAYVDKTLDKGLLDHLSAPHLDGASLLDRLVKGPLPKHDEVDPLERHLQGNWLVLRLTLLSDLNKGMGKACRKVVDHLIGKKAYTPS